MRYTKQAARDFWMFGTDDGRDVTMLGFKYREDRDHHYGMVQTYGAESWQTMGRTQKAATKSQALAYLGTRFPGCTVTVRYPADEAADAADAKAEDRAYMGSPLPPSPAAGSAK